MNGGLSKARAMTAFRVLEEILEPVLRGGIPADAVFARKFRQDIL